MNSDQFKPDDEQDETSSPQNVTEPVADNSNLIELYKKLIEYKNNLFKIDALLAIEKEPETLEELTKLRAELIPSISYQEDVIKFTQNSDDYIYNHERLTNEHIDRLAQCYFQPENKWYISKIENIDIDNQEAEVIFFGLKDKIKLHVVFVKLIPTPNAALFEVGTWCEAIYNDGKYYTCIIEKIAEAGYHIKFRKYNNKEIVGLDYLRPIDNADADAGAKNKKKFEENEVAELKIPKHLKILPNDSETQRKTKKKKIKALKQGWKIAQIEKDTSEKQNKWSLFTDKKTEMKKGFFKKTESIFKSPETIEGKVGVMGSGKGMTNFNQRTKYSMSDNSNLSSLF